MHGSSSCCLFSGILLVQRRLRNQDLQGSDKLAFVWMASHVCSSLPSPCHARADRTLI